MSSGHRGHVDLWPQRRVRSQIWFLSITDGCGGPAGANGVDEPIHDRAGVPPGPAMILGPCHIAGLRHAWRPAWSPLSRRPADAGSG